MPVHGQQRTAGYWAAVCKLFAGGAGGVAGSKKSVRRGAGAWTMIRSRRWLLITAAWTITVGITLGGFLLVLLDPKIGSKIHFLSGQVPPPRPFVQSATASAGKCAAWVQQQRELQAQLGGWAQQHQPLQWRHGPDFSTNSSTWGAVYNHILSEGPARLQLRPVMHDPNTGLPHFVADPASALCKRSWFGALFGGHRRRRRALLSEAQQQQQQAVVDVAGTTLQGSPSQSHAHENHLQQDPQALLADSTRHKVAKQATTFAHDAARALRVASTDAPTNPTPAASTTTSSSATSTSAAAASGELEAVQKVPFTQPLSGSFYKDQFGHPYFELDGQAKAQGWWGGCKAAPQMRRLMAPAARRCLRGRSIGWIGDSVTRYQYLSLTHFLATGLYHHPYDDTSQGRTYTNEKGFDSWPHFYQEVVASIGARSGCSNFTCNCKREGPDGWVNAMLNSYESWSSVIYAGGDLDQVQPVGQGSLRRQQQQQQRRRRRGNSRRRLMEEPQLAESAPASSTAPVSSNWRSAANTAPAASSWAPAAARTAADGKTVQASAVATDTHSSPEESSNISHTAADQPCTILSARHLASARGQQESGSTVATADYSSYIRMRMQLVYASPDFITAGKIALQRMLQPHLVSSNVDTSSGGTDSSGDATERATGDAASGLLNDRYEADSQDRSRGGGDDSSGKRSDLDDGSSSEAIVDDDSGVEGPFDILIFNMGHWLDASYTWNVRTNKSLDPSCRMPPCDPRAPMRELFKYGRSMAPPGTTLIYKTTNQRDGANANQNLPSRKGAASSVGKAGAKAPPPPPPPVISNMQLRWNADVAAAAQAEGWLVYDVNAISVAALHAGMHLHWDQNLHPYAFVYEQMNDLLLSQLCD